MEETSLSLFLIISILLALTALFAVINERFLRLQPSIGLMLLAFLMSVLLSTMKQGGLIGTGWLDLLVRRLDLSEVLLQGVLCLMLFAGSAGVMISDLRAWKWLILGLAVGATLLGALMTGVLLATTLQWFGIALPLLYAVVFGALIAPTDPIAALAILKPLGLPKSLETIINGESLFNDGVGVVIFTVALGILSGSSQTGLAGAAGLFLREVLGGIGLGLLVGYITHGALTRSRSFTNHLLITLATVTLGFGVAMQIEVSGPIAMVVAGIFVGNVTVPLIEEETIRSIRDFWQGIDEVLNSLLFVMIGLMVVLVHDLDAAPLLVVVPVAIIVCLVARLVSVYLTVTTLSVTRILDCRRFGLSGLLTWGGLRGGLALALALSLPDSAEKSLIINMTFGVVVFSILVQGASIGAVFKPAYLRQLLSCPDKPVGGTAPEKR